MSRVNAGAINVSRRFKLVDPSTGVPVTGLTIADLDMSYIRDYLAQSTPVAATALALITTAHTDNYMFEVDATEAPGLYRADFPDAAFASGVDNVTLIIVGAAIDPAFIDITIDRMMTLDTEPDTGVSFQKMMSRIYAWAAGKSPTGKEFYDPTETYKRVEAADAVDGTRPTIPDFVDTDLP